MLMMAVFACAQTVGAHCDTLAGPVVADAKKALGRGDVTPVLKWVRPADEAEVRSAFANTIQVRAVNATAQALADRWFFETVVRLHRASESEPFTGVKTTAIPKPLALTDASLETGNADAFIEHISRDAASLLRARFVAAQTARAHADDSVEAGRRYVAAYVSLLRLVEQLTGEGHDERRD